MYNPLQKLFKVSCEMENCKEESFTKLCVKHYKELSDELYQAGYNEGYLKAKQEYE